MLTHLKFRRAKKENSDTGRRFLNEIDSDLSLNIVHAFDMWHISNQGNVMTDVKTLNEHLDKRKLIVLYQLCVDYKDYLEDKFDETNAAHPHHCSREMLKNEKRNKTLIDQYYAMCDLVSLIEDDEPKISDHEKIIKFTRFFRSVKTTIEKSRDSIGVLFLKCVLTVISLGIAYCLGFWKPNTGSKFNDNVEEALLHDNYQLGQAIA